MPDGHPYIVKWRELDGVDHEASTATRHRALQLYFTLRVQFNDFGPAAGRIVRIFHEGEEYFNEDDIGNTAGKSTRSMSGGYIRAERHMP